MATLNFDTVRDFLSRLASSVKNLEASIAEKRERLAYLRTSPPPLEEFLEVLDAEVERAGDVYSKGLQVALAPLIADKANFSHGLFGQIGGIQNEHGHSSATQTTPLSLIALLGPQIKDSLHKHVRAFYPRETGPGAKDRAREVARLTKEIAEGEEQLKKLREEAYASGVRL